MACWCENPEVTNGIVKVYTDGSKIIKNESCSIFIKGSDIKHFYMLPEYYNGTTRTNEAHAIEHSILEFQQSYSGVKTRRFPMALLRFTLMAQR